MRGRRSRNWTTSRRRLASRLPTEQKSRLVDQLRRRRANPAGYRHRAKSLRNPKTKSRLLQNSQFGIRGQKDTSLVPWTRKPRLALGQAKRKATRLVRQLTKPSTRRKISAAVRMSTGTCKKRAQLQATRLCTRRRRKLACNPERRSHRARTN